MFIYKSNSVERLKTICKSRSYVTNNPELCELLENPFLKDDTELAILHNEYESGKPGAGEKFVDYFYTHGPELDIGTLEEWREIIINDQELYQYGINLNLDDIWSNKRNSQDQNYSWLTDMFDCLARPCQYLDAISDAIGMSIGQMKELYKPENGITPWETGCDMNIWTAPLNMFNKVPIAVQRLATNFGSALGDMWGNILECADTNWTKLSPDMHRVRHAESFGIDVLALIASQKGDCWRLINKNKRYQPYSAEQNKTGADRIGHMVYKNGRAIACNAAGYEKKKSNGNLLLANTKRLQPDGTAQVIQKEVTKALSPIIYNGRLAAVAFTWYSSILGLGGQLFGDGTWDDGSGLGETSGTNGTKNRIIPMNCDNTELMENDIKNGVIWESCVSLSDKLINDYFDVVGCNSGFYSSYAERKRLTTDFLSKARREQAIKMLFVLPNGQRFELPILDRPKDINQTGAAIKHNEAAMQERSIATANIRLLADITANFFVTSTGRKVASLVWQKSIPIGENGQMSTAGQVANELGTVPGPAVNASSYASLVENRHLKKTGNITGSLNYKFNGCTDFNNTGCMCALYFTDQFCIDNAATLDNQLDLYNRTSLVKSLLRDANKQLTSDDPDPSVAHLYNYTTSSTTETSTGALTLGNDPLKVISAVSTYTASEGNLSFADSYNSVTKLDYDNPVFYGGTEADIETYYGNLDTQREAAQEKINNMVAYVDGIYVAPTGNPIVVDLNNTTQETTPPNYVELDSSLQNIQAPNNNGLEASGEGTAKPSDTPGVSYGQVPGTELGDKTIALPPEDCF